MCIRNSIFSYDYNLKRCKYCPNNWKHCKAVKRVNIYVTCDENTFFNLATKLPLFGN